MLKAMELKMQHKPLTPLQQEKYDRFLEKKEEAKKAKEEKENLEKRLVKLKFQKRWLNRQKKNRLKK